MNALEMIIAGSWIALVPLVVSYLIILPIMFSKLERAHPTTYEQLGSPSLFTNNNFSNGLRFMKFLVRKEYEALGDRALSQLATIARWELIVVLVISVASFVIVSTRFVAF